MRRHCAVPLALLPAVLFAGPAPTPPAAPARPVAPIALEHAGLTADEVLKMPDAQTLTLGGKTYTAGEVKALRQKILALKRPASSPAALGVPPGLDALARKLASEQAAKVAEERAREIAAFNQARARK